VPTEGADVCTFCASYDGPPITGSQLTGPGRRPTEVAALLAGASTNARQAAEDIEDMLDALPDDAPLMAVVDAVAARAHLVVTQRLIDRAGARLIAAEVAR